MTAPIRPIIDYIPQRFPMIMIDEIVQCEGTLIETSFEVRSDNQFLLDGKWSESGMLENIAQTAAAKVGYECLKQNVPVPLGFIGAISKVKIEERADVGSQILTTVEVQREVLNVTIIKGTCRSNGNILATCEMKIIIDTSQ